MATANADIDLSPAATFARDYARNGDGLPDELGCLRLLKAFWDHVYSSLRDGHQRTMLWVESDEFLAWCNRGQMVDPEEVRPILRRTYAEGRKRRKAELGELLNGEGGLPVCPDEAELDALLNELDDEAEALLDLEDDDDADPGH